MPFIARRVSRQLTAGQSTGTFQVTHPDIATPGCGLIFTTGALSADGTIYDHGLFGIGVFDASDNQAISNRWRKARPGTQTYRYFTDVSSSALIETSNAVTRGAFAVTSLISGGVECTYQDGYEGNYFADFWLFEGAQNHDIRSNVNLDGGSANIGFKPDILFVFGTTGSGLGTDGKGSFGVAVRDPSDDSITQWSGGWENEHNKSTLAMVVGIAEDHIALRTDGPDPYSAKYAVASFNADGYTFSSAARDMSDTVIFAVQLPPDQHVLAGVRQTRTGVGTDTIPTPYPSGSPNTDAFLLHAHDATTLTTGSAGPVLAKDAICWSMANAGSPIDQAVMGSYDDSGNSTSQSVNSFNESAVLRLENGASAQVFHHAQLTDLDNGVDIETTVTDGNAYWYGWLAIQSGAVAPGDDVEVALPAERLGLTAHAPDVQVPDTVNVQLPAERLGLTARTPDAQVQYTVNVQLPAERLGLIPRPPGISIPNDVGIQPLTANLELTLHAPGVRITEHVGSYLPATQLGLTPRPPGIVAEADVDTSLPRVTLALQAHAPGASDGSGDQSFLPRLALGAQASNPGVDVEFDVDVQLSTVRYHLSAYAPGIYLAGDKATTAPTARLRAMAAPPRVMIGDTATMGPEDGGVVGPTVTEVVVPPLEQSTAS